MPIPLIAAAASAIAPMLAQRGMDLLSGVFRGAVDKGTKEIAGLIEEKTGIDVNDIAENKLSNEQWARLKEFELQHQAQLLAYRQSADANELELEKVYRQDRADARAMQSEATKSEDWLTRHFIHIYSLLITVLTFFFIFWAAFVHDYTTGPEAGRIIDTVLGFLLGVSLSAIIQYFFGSSSGSLAKSKDITKLLTENRTDRSTGSRGPAEG
jgi:Fe2+ transport system protein B